MSSYKEFKQDCSKEIELMAADKRLNDLTREWMNAANRRKYSYHFEWMGRPIIQYPQDVVAMQEVIWTVQPDLIIETGIAHGGSIIFYASLLELLEISGGPRGGRVVGIDIDIRAHNREAITVHPMSKRIDLIQGSSIDNAIVSQVADRIGNAQRVMVVLDSNHTHDHVLKELELYAGFVTPGSYLVVFDTVIENMSADMFGDRPWSVGNNPMTAVQEFLKTNPAFTIDEEIHSKLSITVAPNGYLRRR